MQKRVVAGSLGHTLGVGMDKKTQRELAVEIAKAARRDREKRVGTGCLVLLVVIVGAVWLAQLR